MKSFDFWSAWLLSVSALLALLGLWVAIAPDSALFAHHTEAIALAFFQGSMPEEAGDLRKFLFAPLGATIAGYFLMQAFIAYGPFRRREPWAWHAIMWPLLLWFAVDSGLSIYRGAFFNVWMINVWPLWLVAAPLAMTCHSFRSRSSS